MPLLYAHRRAGLGAAARHPRGGGEFRPLVDMCSTASCAAPTGRAPLRPRPSPAAPLSGRAPLRPPLSGEPLAPSP